MLYICGVGETCFFRGAQIFYKYAKLLTNSPAIYIIDSVFNCNKATNGSSTNVVGEGGDSGGGDDGEGGGNG